MVVVIRGSDVVGVRGSDVVGARFVDGGDDSDGEPATVAGGRSRASRGALAVESVRPFCDSLLPTAGDWATRATGELSTASPVASGVGAANSETLESVMGSTSPTARALEPSTVSARTAAPEIDTPSAASAWSISEASVPSPTLRADGASPTVRPAEDSTVSSPSPNATLTPPAVVAATARTTKIDKPTCFRPCVIPTTATYHSS